MAKKKYHKISNAYEAYWFLKEHPKFQRRERTEVTPAKARKLKKQGFLITRDKGGKCYREYRHHNVPALIENLDIVYAHVDSTRRVNKDATKNVNVEVWLEFGSVEYGYMAGGEFDWDTETGKMNYHDWQLDCGAPTFDEALVILARKVLKSYGDFAPYKRSDKCGKPVCADCKQAHETSKRLGLGQK